MRRLAFWALFLTAIPQTSLLSAAEGNSPKAVTTVAEADADFAVQGEYLGTARNACGRCESIGLQVIAMGKGEFHAVEYRGGLPGYGWPIGGERIKYQGQRDGDAIRLTSEGRQLLLTGGQASITAGEKGEWSVGQAAKVTRQSPTLGLRAPCNATVLFDGTNTDQWKDGKLDGDLLKEGTETKEAFGDFQLHLEFMLPYMPNARGQGRANSGVYIQSRYEVQVLDSFGLEGAINECGSLYTQRRPDLNMCLPPLAWQTYDITFFGPRFDSEGKKAQNARITVLHNGVPVQNNVDVIAKTGGGAQEGPSHLVTKLQNHGNPVRYRNVWLVNYGHPQPVCSQPLAAIETPLKK